MKSLILAAALVFCGTASAKRNNYFGDIIPKFPQVMEEDNEIVYNIPSDTIIKGSFYKEQDDTVGDFIARISA